jgi:hypothetical protein
MTNSRSTARFTHSLAQLKRMPSLAHAADLDAERVELLGGFSHGAPRGRRQLVLVLQTNATTRAVIAEIRRTGATTLAAIAAELEKRGVRTPAGRSTWAPAQVSRLLAV